MPKVTEQLLRIVTQNAKLRTRQAASSIPMIQRYADRAEAGEVPPAIHIAQDVIVEGNHRYLAGLCIGKIPPMRQWIERSNPGPIVPWDQVKFDPADWDSPQ